MHDREHRRPAEHDLLGRAAVAPTLSRRPALELLSISSVQRLQRTVGNRAAASLLRTSQDRPSGRRVSAPRIIPLGSVQRFSDEDVRQRAYFNWEKKDKPNQDKAAQDADYFEARNQLQAELKNSFEKAVDDRKPIEEFRKLLSEATDEQKKVIWSDATLMNKAETAVGQIDFMALVAILGVNYSGSVPHTTGAEADKVIRDQLGDYVAKAVKAGVKVEGQVAILDDTTWQKVYFTQFPSDTDEEEQQTNAFVAGKQASRPIILHKDRGNPGTAIHEGMHKYSNLAVRDLSTGLNEGVTEYFTRIVTTPLKIDRDNYDDNYLLAKELVSLVGGQDKMADVYFDGKTNLLKKAFIDHRKTKGESQLDAESSWREFLESIENDDWDDATDMLK